MKFILLLNCFASPLEITHDLRSSYPNEHPIVVTFRIHNKSDTSVQIPDLSYQTWKTSFVLQTKNKKETRSNEKKSDSPQWILQPHGARLLRMEIPGSRTLKKGNYELTVRIDYDLDQFVQSQEITIHTKEIVDVDVHRSINGKLSTLWTEENTQGTYYNTGSNLQFVHSKNREPKLILHPNTTPYDFNVQERDVYVRGKQELRVTLPYPDARVLSRVSLYKDQFHVPFLLPKSGTLMLLHLSQQGVPSYRNVRKNTPEIIRTTAIHSSLGTPLYLFHHKEGVEILRVEPPEDPKWPINSKYVYKKTSKETIRFAQFDLHPEEGIAVSLITEEEQDTYRIWVSLLGSIIHKEKLTPFPKGSIVDAYQSALLLEDQNELLLIDEKGQHRFPKRENCRINKNGLFCFQDGNWERHAPSLSSQSR